MSYVGRMWRGELPLAVTFFGFHLGGWATLFALGHLLSRTMPVAGYVWASFLLIPIWLAFFVWSLTGLWRAAEHVSKWPKMFARGWVMVVGLTLVQTLILPIFFK
ncbi:MULTISPECIES: hypothetical protein [Corallincola]|uniref:Uncharacterized protein n=3 Tax=Corallincola TaxID=1775176 RepID=A0A368NPC0_9GAMM|nr:MULTISPECIES: hypothetical protein [Corallincola]RCU51705.1 hypothetical protein DU002_04335 [Corallincola holothuriorum]TAA47203.1 hypothetical protein EXY25_08155 [Corallincola spongiicola]TCI04864.1 hypothetical protein EZV61_02525 [Corallincola luteus]